MLTNQSTSNTGAIPKEKTTKSTKQQQPRKPPPTTETFWPSIMQDVQSIAMVDAKHQALPLARIKKIMKLDENAKMIAAEAPLLFAKACEFFIQELTMRAWIHTDESKRRTLQRSDIAQAIANYDQFDFLIDIVPREDIKPSSHRKHHSNDTNTVSNAGVNNPTNTSAVSNEIKSEPVFMETVSTLPQMVDQQSTASGASATAVNTQPTAAQVLTTSHPTQQLQIIQQTAQPQQHMQYFITMPSQQQQGQAQLQLHQLQLQQQQQLPNTIGTPLTASSLNLVAQQPQQQLILTTGNHNNQANNMSQQAALLNLVQQHQQQQQQQHMLQQVMVAPQAEISNIPIAINANQLNLLRLQMQQQQQQQQQHQQHHQQHQVQQNTHQPTQQQQVIIPANCQLLTAQQLLQLQQNHANTNGGTGAATAHIVHHQQPTQQHHASQPATNTIYINASNATATPANVQTATASLVSTDRNMANTFRNNC